jgi:molybdate-binding protein|tara:strand:- start:482 stop:679 length:198 start_codon:yes stop_codon:yes gene_type:complete
VDYIVATEHLLRKIRERKDALSQTLAAGSIEDFIQYQRVVGEIAGLSFVEQEIQTLHSNMEDAND